MKRIIFIILTLFLFLINTSVKAAPALTQKDIKVVTKDGFNIYANLTYPKIKGQKEFQTVVLLHSLGYNSQWWENLPKNFLNKGYAVLTIDLRGHGKSIYNSRFTKLSWKNLKNSGYAKYPTDVVAVIEEIKKENTSKQFFNQWAIVGADIGASTGILAADKLKSSPKIVVMISPVVETKSLYIPVSIAHLENSDFLSISGTDDTDSQKAAEYLSKFAQNQFMTFTSESKSTGMLMLKNDPGLTNFITEWVSEYLN
jgi:pimeloyl-ACP methyl ester carboxylesterase